jgi:hypothetical protein
MPELTHLLERTLLIEATRSIVFRFFTDTDRWAAWWGGGSAIDPRPGGRVLIRYPNGVQVLGEVLEIAEPERIVFTYGYESGKPIPPGGSRVTIRPGGGRKRHAASPGACLRRRGCARSALTGSALPVVAVRQPGGTPIGWYAGWMGRSA